MRKIYPWTPDEIDFVRTSWNAGVTAQIIADRLNKQYPDKVRNKNSVIGLVHRIGLSPHYSPLQSRKQKAKIKAEVKVKVKEKDKKKMQELDVEDEPVILLPANKKKIRMADLTDKTCRFPIGDPRDADFHFCGCKPQDKSPYCVAHTASSYSKAYHRRDRSHEQN